MYALVAFLGSWTVASNTQQVHFRVAYIRINLAKFQTLVLYFDIITLLKFYIIDVFR